MFSIPPRVLANLHVAFGAVLTNKVRSLLTALGIIFGVAAVIAMLAIGNGAQQQILAEIELVGVNNIVILPLIEQKDEKVETQGKQEKRKFSPGLTVRDVRNIQKTVPGITQISPEIILETHVIRDGVRRSAKLVGVEPAYFNVNNLEVGEGKMFNAEDRINGAAVCLVGYSIKARFFPTQNALGKRIKVGDQWLTIVGVLRERAVSEASLRKLDIRDVNMDIYAPLQSVLIRFKNRDRVTPTMQQRDMFRSAGMVTATPGDEDEATRLERKNYHQLDHLIVQVEDTRLLAPTADILTRMLKRRHYDVVDFEVKVPELLLKQKQRTDDIFKWVLVAIACISLLVGGIGIMNIMLASVLERIKEIGLRLSVGAKKSDVIQQFLFEAIMISVAGGILGVILGVALAYIVAQFANIPTVISFASIVLSFGVAATVGLIFGIAPARKAASQDPIASLRYE